MVKFFRSRTDGTAMLIDRHDIAYLGRVALAALVAAGMILVISSAIDFEQSFGAPLVALAVGGFLIGFAGAFPAIWVAGLLPFLPPVFNSLPEDPWLGLLTLFVLVIAYIPVAVAGAGAGALVNKIVAHAR